MTDAIHSCDYQYRCYAPSEIKYKLLDPGVREVVRLLVSAGFCTTDSGDGEAKRASGWTENDGLVPFPHVYMQVEPNQIALECQRLIMLMAGARIKVVSQTEAWVEAFAGDSAGDSEKPRPYIEATYDPVSGHALIGLFHVTSEMVIRGEPK